MFFQTPEKKQSETPRGRKRKPEIQSESSQGVYCCVKAVTRGLPLSYDTVSTSPLSSLFRREIDRTRTQNKRLFRRKFAAWTLLGGPFFFLLWMRGSSLLADAGHWCHHLLSLPLSSREEMGRVQWEVSHRWFVHPRTHIPTPLRAQPWVQPTIRVTVTHL